MYHDRRRHLAGFPSAVNERDLEEAAWYEIYWGVFRQRLWPAVIIAAKLSPMRVSPIRLARSYPAILELQFACRFPTVIEIFYIFSKLPIMDFVRTANRNTSQNGTRGLVCTGKNFKLPPCFPLRNQSAPPQKPILDISLIPTRNSGCQSVQLDVLCFRADELARSSHGVFKHTRISRGSIEQYYCKPPRPSSV